MWVREAEAVTVVAHAQHGRLGLVRELVDALPRALATLLTHPVDSVFLVDLPIAGALPLALGMAEMTDGARAADDSGARAAPRPPA